MAACVSGRGVSARHAAHTPQHILPHAALQKTTYFNWLYLQKSNFGQAQYRLPDDGLHEPKHVGVTVEKPF